MLLLAAKTMQGAPFAGFQDTLCARSTTTSCCNYSTCNTHKSAQTNAKTSGVYTHTNTYTHKAHRARTNSSTFGACQERLQRDRDKRVSPDYTHKQTPFACVCNYVLAYKAPICRQMVVITGFYYHLSLILYTGYSVQIPHLASNLYTACLR